MGEFVPAYLTRTGPAELAVRARLAQRHLNFCDLCARYCRIDRRERVGACRTGVHARVASYGPHHGEEDPVRGWAGSGTVFFAGCNLRCTFCQNHDISQGTAGREVEAAELAAIMLHLQERGCHNINLVSPSHVVAQILEAVALAARAGLRVPLVYNTGGYDSPEALALLDGVIDIYMPDMKYSEARTARLYSRALDYPGVNRRAVREMHRQVGDLVLDRDGLAQRGLLVRHLVLPNDLAGTAEVVRFLAQEVSPRTYLNLMDQYRPSFRAVGDPALGRRISAEELQAARESARAAGLHRLDSLAR